MKIIKIKKNRHKSINCYLQKIIFFVLDGYRMKRSYTFTDSCIYKYDDDSDKDKNTLFGFTFGCDRHCDSFRFSWNCNELLNKIDIFCYTYQNGVLKKEFIQEIELNKPYTFMIDYSDGEVEYRVISDSGIKSIPIKYESVYGMFGKTIGCRFGDKKRFNRVAPHDIKIIRN